MHVKFQDIPDFTEQDVEDAVARNADDELPLVPLIVAMVSNDVDYAVRICTMLAEHDKPGVRANAICGLGHLARRFGTLNEPSVRPIITAALSHHDPDIRLSAKSAADEIHQFLGWHFPGHTFG